MSRASAKVCAFSFDKAAFLLVAFDPTAVRVLAAGKQFLIEVDGEDTSSEFPEELKVFVDEADVVEIGPANAC